MLGDHVQAVVPGILTVVGWAAMDDDGELRRLCQLHLPAENCLLYISGRVVVKIIEADFSPGDYLGMPRPLQHLGISGLVREACFMGMKSYAGPDSWILGLSVVFFRQLNPAVGGVGSVAVADCEIGFDAVLFGTDQHLFTIVVVALAFEMGVGVDEHQISCRLPAASCQQLFYLSLVPTGTSSRKLARTGLPPSGEAATIMPLDSRPRNLRGARLATITTLRPISVSGSYASAIPATSWRTSVPRSTSRRSNLSAPFTRSAVLTWATRNSTFAKSSMLILPSGIAALGLTAAASGLASTAGCFASLGWTGEAPVTTLAVCSSIFCILSTADLSARGNTACTSPSFVPRCSCPHCNCVRSNFVMSPRPICAQILAVASGMTGCASTVTIRKASALV